MRRLLISLLLGATLASSHPMGNFSVSHYARLEATARGIDLTYALDLAEIPTFDLLRSWKLDRTSPRNLLDAKAREQAKLWLSRLQIEAGGKPAHAKFLGCELVIADGAGNLPVIRITTRARVSASGGALAYEDPNFPERAGWKEIVIVARDGATVRQASQTSADISHALTHYPPDPTLAPPQDLRAELTWVVDRPVLAQRMPAAPATPEPKPVIKTIPQPRYSPLPTSPALMTPAAAPMGSVIRGDFLSKLLHQRDISPWMMLVAIAAAFILGGGHALTPGHGKTIVAAYLVGSRGTLKHAAFLGAMVTFTHTISVFALGLATLFLFRFVIPEKITEWLGVISGLSIVALGLWMAYKRLRAASRHAHSHDHGHDHHDHDHHHAHEHSHESHEHHHHHGPGGHTHMPDELSWAGLAALGASGGLVPCESALVLLLGAIALRKVGLGLMLLVSFSAGLAIVLMAIGAVVLYAKNLLPQRAGFSSNSFFRFVPVASAVLVTLVGVIMTGISLGWIQPSWMIG